MKCDDRLKLSMANQSLLRASIREVERRHHVSIMPVDEEARDTAYYPQFSASVRAEAAAMAKHYEVFYCLEKSIRSLIVEKMLAERGPSWWDQCVPESVKSEVVKNRARELDYALTVRSDNSIDYTTFGQLGEIVRTNPDVFADIFSSQKGFDRVMTNLNLLRGPIAHCCPLAQDEIDRLRLTLRDWFRLMS